MKKFRRKVNIIIIIGALLLWSSQPVLVFAETTEVDSPEVKTEEPQPPIEEEEINNEEPVEPGEIEIETGDASSIIDVENKVNHNETTVDNKDQTETTDSEEELVDDEDVLDFEQVEKQEECDDCELDQSATNEDTGEDSTNVSKNIDVEVVEITNENEANVDNNVTGDSNSGDNQVNDNLANIDLSTGEVQLISNIFNLINFNVVGTNYLNTAYSLVGNIVGDLDLSRYSIESLAEEVTSNESFQELETEIEATNKDTGDGSTNTSEVTDLDITDISNDNEAEINNEIILDANSGLNDVIGNSSGVKMVTGNISVSSNLVNIVNTNIIGNGWTLAIINIVGQWVGDLVLPSLTSVLSSQQEDFSLTCQDYSCLDSLGTASNADTGNDSTNQSTINQTQGLFIDNNNEAVVNNDIEVVANSGGNEVFDNEGETEVTTGKTSAISQVYNQVNTNIIENNWVYGMVNVMGSWLGDFYGQPDEGFTTQQQGGNWTFSYNPELMSVTEDLEPSEAGENQEVLKADTHNTNTGDDSENTANIDQQQIVNIENNNQAEVNNVIKILANSGGNFVAGNGGDVNMQTGDVMALSNVMNLVNTNMIGHNWTMAMVNIVGDWEGDIHFGKPDLVITEIAQPNPEPAKPGGLIDYYITVTNKGDAPATNVELMAEVDEYVVEVVETDGGIYQDSHITWMLDKVGIGEIIVKHYQARIKENTNDKDDVFNHAEVWSIEEDRNPDDNIAHTQVTINKSGLQLGMGFPVYYASGSKNNDEKKDSNSQYDNPVFNNSLKIEKYNDAAENVYREQTVNYTIELKNESEQSLYDVIVYDFLKDPDDKLINSQTWELGEVLPYEDIKINYSLNITADANPGEYVNIAYADGFDEEDRYSLFPQAESSINVSDLTPQVAASFVDIQMHYQPTKNVGSSDEETIIITNLGSTTLPAGQLVMTYGDAISVNENQTGGIKIDIPALEPQDTQTVQFDVVGLTESDSTIMNISYLTLGVPVAGVTANYQIALVEEEENVIPSAPQITGVSEVSNTSEPIDLSEVDDRKVKVLGYLGYDNTLPGPPLTVASNFWISIFDNLSSWWFWFGLLIVLALIEIYRRYRRGDKFWERTFGFRIF